MLLAALAMVLTTFQGVPKPLSDAWLPRHLSGAEAFTAQQKAGVTIYQSNGPFILVKTTADVDCAGSFEGEGCFIRGPARIQLGNDTGLKEYALGSGSAICFATAVSLSCAMAPSAEEMRERTRPAPHSP
jgi:hypothetical protein